MRDIAFVIAIILTACNEPPPVGWEPVGGAGGQMSTGTGGHADAGTDAPADAPPDVATDAPYDAPSPPCGCLTSNGGCVSGGSVYACGSNGAACEDCAAKSGECAVWDCVERACSVTWIDEGLSCSGGVCRSGQCVPPG